MTKGIKAFDPKRKREQRRKNHIAKDLFTPKYKQKVIEPSRLEDEEERRFRRYKELEDGEE